ncbi:MBG domain-containing protein [uncultured Pedobacter sp.]|uniref:MBG domain-containing protein n=1 Tax=uncultured Pedobacter sp. TaxID=246139 RepID=UPI0025D7D073|nr:MBG domain-containing protein [uncultured Pedobacter sp.]
MFTLPVSTGTTVSQWSSNFLLRKKLWALLIGLMISLSAMAQTPDANGILYVDINKTNGDGSSWDSPIKQLADALKFANENEGTVKAIYVAKGTYTPLYFPDNSTNTTKDPRNKTFLMVNKVNLYGGFDPANGIKTLTDNRIFPSADGSDSGTILSGDFNNDDVVSGSGKDLTFSNNGENAYHVLVSVDVSSAELDGFSVKDGNAAINGYYITVKSRNIWARHGGGIYNYSSSPVINRCKFYDNKCFLFGGGIFNEINSSPVIKHSSFYQNSATLYGNGGGIYNNGGNQTITDCIFSNNYGGSTGGGIYNDSNSSTQISRCSFNNNTASDGGGMYNYKSTSNISLCNFYKNFASKETGSGGLTNDSQSSATISQSIFYGNIGGYVVHNTQSSTAWFINISMSGNVNTSNNGPALGLYLDYNSNGSIVNSIIYNDLNSTNTQVICENGGQLTIKSSIVRGFNPYKAKNIAPDQVITNDPLFNDPSKGDLTLQSKSPAIDKGNNDAYTNAGGQLSTDKDLAGNQRLAGSAIDMGAFEAQFISQSITASNINKTYGDSPFEPGATASSGLAVSYASANNSIAEAYQDANDGNKWKIKIKKAGKVNITASQAGNSNFYAATPVTFELNIAKAPSTASGSGADQITFSDASFVYDGMAKDLSVANLPTGATASYNGNGKTNVGKYDVSVTVSQPNYEDIVKTAKLTISKAPNTPSGSGINTITFSDASFVYDGTAKDLSVANLPTGATVSYNGNGKTNAGTYTVTATVVQPNYDDIVKTAKLTISKAPNTASGSGINTITFSDASFVYDGTAKDLSVAKLPTGATASYNGNGKTNAGTYTVTATVVQPNYEDIVKTAKLTISKAPNTTSGSGINTITFSDASFVYDGTAKNLSVANLPTGAAVSYSGNGKTNAGTYAITATVVQPNYEDIVKTAKLTISKAPNTASGSGINTITFADASFVYDGTAKDLSVANLPTGATASYVGNGQINAGIYTVTATVVQSDYEDIVKTAKLTISKAPNTTSGSGINTITFADAGFVYDGTAKYLSVANLPTGATVSYVGNGKTNAGTYAVTATVVQPNYEDIVKTATLTIRKAASPDANGILYVNINKTDGDGSSWDSPMKQLADALKFANANNKVSTNKPVTAIYVAKGTYKPLYTPEDRQNFKDSTALVVANKNQRDRAFLMVKDVKLFGGFDPDNNIKAIGDQRILPGKDGSDVGTVLSGDFNDDDIVKMVNDKLNFKNNGENAYHVLISAGDVGSAEINGFGVRGGNANGNQSGIEDGIKVNNFSIPSNNGAGLYDLRSSPLIIQVSFYNNNAFSQGGGIYNFDRSFPTINKSNFFNNNATARGGGICNINYSSLTVSESNFYSNTAKYGGGINNWLASSTNPPNISRSNFYNNSAISGGGIYNNNSSPIVTQSSFYKNIASQGSGIFNSYSSNPTLLNVSITGNTAVTNDGKGGGIYFDATSAGSLINSILYNNTTPDNSNNLNRQEVYSENTGSAPVSIKNSILTDYDASKTLNVLASDVINTDPLFNDPSKNDFTLKSGSPAIGRGSNEAYNLTTGNKLNTDKDLAGNPRLTGANIDMGAYESLVPDQAITANNISKTYGDAPFEPGATASSGLTVSYASADNTIGEAFQDANDGNKWKIKINKAGKVSIKASQGGNGSIPAATPVTFELTIAPKNINASINANSVISKTYDGNRQNTIDATNLSFGQNDVLNADDVKLSLSANTVYYDNKNAGKNKIIKLPISAIQLSGAQAGNYILANTDSLSVSTAEIKPADLTITAKDSTKIYDGTPYTGGNSISYSGFVNNENESVLTGALNYGGAANGAVNVGEYQIELSGLTNPNYSIKYNTAKLTITKAPNTTSGSGINTITFSDASFVYDGTAKDLSVANLPTGATASYNGNGKTNAGTYVVTATVVQANYADIVKTATLTISKAPNTTSGSGINTITFSDASFVYDGTAKDLTIANLPAGATVSYNGNGKTNAGTYTVTATVVQPNYEDIVKTANLTIRKEASPDANGILYVNINKTDGDGSSWDSPMKQLADALKFASTNNKVSTNPQVKAIYVAKGTYKPLYTPEDGQNFKDSTALADPRDRAFLMVKDVKMYGGFDPDQGIRLMSDERILPADDGTEKGTILSGDFNNDDVVAGSNNQSPRITNNGENAYHVLIATGNLNTAELNGFSIKGGNATGDPKRAYQVGNVTVNLHMGGGLSNSSPKFSIKQSAFYHNKAKDGAGIFNNNARPLINQTSFHHNEAYSGGAMYNMFFSAPSISLCKFYNNTVDSIGGALRNSNSSPNISQSSFYRNLAGCTGGAIFNAVNTHLTLLQISMNGNEAGKSKGRGAAIYYDSTSDGQINNSIVYGNTTPNNVNNPNRQEIDSDNGNIKVNVLNSIVKDYDISNTLNLAATAVMNEDPMFSDPSTGNLALKKVSPAIGKGSNEAYTRAGGKLTTDLDLAGNPRLIGANIDMGAYESSVPDQVITAGNISKTYGDAPFEPGATASSGLAVSYASEDNTIAEAYQDAADGNKWKVSIKKVGKVKITANQSGNGSIPAATPVTFELNIVPKSITAGINTNTIISKTYDGNRQNTIDATSLSLGQNDVVNTDDVKLSLSANTVFYNNKNAGKNKTIKLPLSSLQLSGAQAGNYILANTDSLSISTAEIKPADLTISPMNSTKVYDGIPYNGGNAISYSGFVNNENESVLAGTLTYGGAANGAINVGEYQIVLSGLTSTNYSIKYNTAKLTITKSGSTDPGSGISTITFADAAFTYDGTAKSIFAKDLPAGATATYTGNGQTNVGVYTVTATITQANYADVVKTATLTINKSASTDPGSGISTITFADAAFTYDGTAKSIFAANLPAGATVTYTGNGQTNAGVYTVTATITQANYADVVKTATLTINKSASADPGSGISTITFADAAFTYDGTAKSIFAANLPAGATATYTGNGQTNAGVYTVTATITQANYADVVKTATLTINKSVSTDPGSGISTITFADAAFTYDGTAKSIFATNLPTGALATYAGNGQTNAGVYTVTATITQANYADVVKTATLTINKNVSTDPGSGTNAITFADGSFTYDGTAKSIFVTNLPAGATVTYLGNGQINAGTYTVTATISQPNYTDIVKTATLVIHNAIVPHEVSYVSSVILTRGMPMSDLSPLVKGGTAAKFDITPALPNGLIFNIATGVISGVPAVISPETVYKISVTFTDNTVAVTTLNLAVIVPDLIYTGKEPIQNMLTPDGNGKNDVWVLDFIKSFPNNMVKVSDRTGRLVYQKQNYDNSWDGSFNGKPLPEGTYYYIIDLGQGIPKRRGFITILYR